MGGSATLDMVAAVAKLEPHTAAKPAQATTVDMARPPRRWPMKALAALNRSSDSRETAMKPPISTNNGITESSSLSTVVKAT